MNNMPTLGTDPEIVTVATSVERLRSLGIPEELLGMPMPAFFSLGVQNAEQPRKNLSFGQLTPDGMAAEFTIDPSNDVPTMVERIRVNIAETKQIARQNDCVLTVEPHFHTDQWYINRLPEEYGDACSLQVLGCAPDHCVYNIDIPDRPDPRSYPFRTSGGHIHVEVGERIVKDRALTCYTVAAMDAFLGTAATYLCTSSQAFDRKKMYGSAGMIRVNSVLGTIEYRTLPAQALIQTPKLAEMMFTAAQTVCGHIMDVAESMPQPDAVKYLQSMIGSYRSIIDGQVTAINAHMVDECRRIQAAVADRFSSYATITAVVNELQSYIMPTSFELVGWE